MSGHRKFSELTKKFTPEDWRKIEEIKSVMRLALNAEVSKFDTPNRHDQT